MSEEKKPIPSTEWETPNHFFQKLNKEFNFCLDVCANNKNKKCPYFYSLEDNALSIPWAKPNVDGVTNDSSLWMNPPYGRSITNKWVIKAYNESINNRIVCLLPAKTDTKWWGTFWDFDNNCPYPGVEVRFIKGRIRFSGAPSSGRFPSVVVIMDRRSEYEKTN